MNRGYVKLWRKSLDAGWIKNHKTWVFWTYCLMKASHKSYKAIVGNQEVFLEPGQFVTGLRVIAKETGLTIRETRTVLAFLKNAGNVTIKTTNKYSIITIVNWHIYQPVESENDTLNDKRTTNDRQHTRTREHKNKNYTSDFESFWAAYPRKVGKGAAFKVWEKNHRPSLDKILEAIERQKQTEQWQDEKYIPHPTTWLNQGRWDDEIRTGIEKGDSW